MKSFKYKNWYCKFVASEGLFYLYSPSEMEQPAGFRDHDSECSTSSQCKEFINSY
jgi:hypothetical protein